MRTRPTTTRAGFRWAIALEAPADPIKLIQRLSNIDIQTAPGREHRSGRNARTQVTIWIVWNFCRIDELCSQPSEDFKKKMEWGDPFLHRARAREQARELGDDPGAQHVRHLQDFEVDLLVARDARCIVARQLGHRL